MSNIFNLSNIFTESSFPIALRNVTSGEVYRLSGYIQGRSAGCRSFGYDAAFRAG